MRRSCRFFFFLPVFVTALSAATVVTQTERIQGTIVAEDEKSLTIRGEKKNEIRITRAVILQIFDDQGELVWQAKLPPEEKRIEPVAENKARARLPHAVTLDFYLGGATGGIYSDENRLVDDLRISTQYSDGSTQYAKSSMSALGGGASYRHINSERLSTLISYAFRSTMQTVYIGDGQDYGRNTLSSLALTRIHALFYGKEASFFPFSENLSFDLVGQIGYTLGSYSPLVTYNDYRVNLMPVPVQYTGIQTATIHGPALRAAGGVTFHSGPWQFRLLGYYQLSALFLPERTVISNSISSLVHDFYGAVSLGYGW